MRKNSNKKEKIILSIEQIMAQVDDLHGTSLINLEDEVNRIYKELTQLTYNINKYLMEKKSWKSNSYKLMR